jgi:hypothetical protein
MNTMENINVNYKNPFESQLDGAEWGILLCVDIENILYSTEEH